MSNWDWTDWFYFLTQLIVVAFCAWVYMQKDVMLAVARDVHSIREQTERQRGWVSSADVPYTYHEPHQRPEVKSCEYEREVIIVNKRGEGTSEARICGK